MAYCQPKTMLKKLSMLVLLIRQCRSRLLVDHISFFRSAYIFWLLAAGLFRRDEMWVAERNSKGSSELLSFSDYKDVRYDKDIRKSYLQGRLGGVPRFLLSNALISGRKCACQNGKLLERGRIKSL